MIPPAPHPIEIRTVLMCALLQAGHDVATAAVMLDEAEAVVRRAAGVTDSLRISDKSPAPAAAPEPNPAPVVREDRTPEPAEPHRPARARIRELDTANMTPVEIAERRIAGDAPLLAEASE